MISLMEIDPNYEQPRKTFDEDALAELAESIKMHGVIQPIVVTPIGKRFMIIAGERRFRASKLAGKKDIPAIVRNYTPQQIKEISIIENLQREDLSPIEAARAIKTLMTEFNMTQEVAADRIGKSRSAVANTLRLLTLSDEVIELIEKGRLSAGHARVLAGISDREQQANLFAKTLQFGWSVRQLEAAAQSAPEKKPRKERLPLPAEYEELQDRIRTATGLKVSMEGTPQKGKIVLQYNGEEELQRLWELLEHP